MLEDREKAFEKKMAMEEESEFRLNALIVRIFLEKISHLLSFDVKEELLKHCLQYEEKSFIQDIMQTLDQNSIIIPEHEIKQILQNSEEEALKLMGWDPKAE